MNVTAGLAVNRFDPVRPPVVLMGGISLVRALGLAGIPAIVASADPSEPAFNSRHCFARHLLPPLEDSQAVADSLVDLARQLSARMGWRIPLMYGSDDALEVIYAHRDRLERHYLLMLSDPDVATALIAKDRFQELAVSRGLPVPLALKWDGDGPGTVQGTAGAVLVKPRMKSGWHHTALCQGLFGGDGKALVFDNSAAAVANADIALFRNKLTFQEYIPGGDGDLWSYHGLADADGEVLVSFIGRKLRTFPTLTGESAFIEMAHDESLDRLGREVARRCPLRGVFKMDFKRDPRDGRWYLLEINARYTLWHYVGARNGLNLMAAAYGLLVDGKRPVQPAYGTRYRWLSLALDFKAYREMAARGEITFTQWAASILRSRNVYALFSFRDPGPWWHFWVARIRRKLKRGPTRLYTALRKWRSTAS